MNYHTIHLAVPYYRPSWQGGDTYRALCQSGRMGFVPVPHSTSLGRVDCPECLSLGSPPADPRQANRSKS